MLSYDGYDCTNLVILESFIWSIALASILKLVWTHIRAFRVQLAAYRRAKSKVARRGQTLYMWQFTPLRLLVAGFCAIPIMLTVIIPKAFLLEDRELGRTWKTSAAFIITVPFGFIGNFIAEMYSFDTLAKGLHSSHPEQAVKLRRQILFQSSFAIGSYACITAVAVIYGCTHTITHPNKSVMRYMLILRNGGLILYMQATGLIARAASKNARALLQGLSNSVQSAETIRAQNFLRHFEALSAEKIKLAKVTLVLYIVFSLPWLWPYQTYPIALVFIKIGGKAHFANSFAAPRQKKNGSVKYQNGNSVAPSSSNGSVTSIKQPGTDAASVGPSHDPVKTSTLDLENQGKTTSIVGVES